MLKKLMLKNKSSKLGKQLNKTDGEVRRLMTSSPTSRNMLREKRSGGSRSSKEQNKCYINAICIERKQMYA